MGNIVNDTYCKLILGFLMLNFGIRKGYEEGVVSLEDKP